MSKSSLRLIVPFLRPIEHLLEDDTVSEIIIFPNRAVFAERGGLSKEETGITLDAQKLTIGVKNIARQLGKDFGELCPILDARLPNGFRICAIWTTVALGEVLKLNIRKFQGFRSIDDLVASGSLPVEVLSLLKEAIASRHNILISGGVAGGKTSLLRALVTLIDSGEIITTIEDTAELNIQSHRGLTMLEAKVEQRGSNGEILSPGLTMRDLVRSAMRQPANRLIIGETRGAEAFDLLKALNSGASGSLTTIHADSATLALEKLALYVLEANMRLPLEAIYRHIAAAIHYVLQQEKRPNGSRGVVELIRVHGHDGRSFETTSLFNRLSPNQNGLPSLPGHSNHQHLTKFTPRIT